ncbi:MAG: hypothetical protein WAM30_10230 [Candidatus Dormiibacterota bacterium]
MTRFEITRTAQRRTHILTRGPDIVASLHVAHSRVPTGEIDVDGRTWAIAGHPHRWWQIEVGDPKAPTLAFERHHATVPGIEAPLPWELHGRLRHFHTTLGVAEQQITVDCAGLRLRHADASVTGEWQHLGLTVLACFFAVLVRRRRGILLLST